MKIMLIAGARPNFMKIAPIVHAARARADVETIVVHTGQHYDADMSRVFFEDLDMSEPAINLEIGSGSHALQTGRAMAALEPVMETHRPRWTLVVGDVNSTLAASLVAVKMGLPTAHVEAGLRSGDRSMPEEINRLATDAVCDVLFTPSREASETLRREGQPEERIAFAGNVMIDSLLQARRRVDAATVRRRMEVETPYALVTLHRPSNVDDPQRLQGLLHEFDALARRMDVIFPVHPRTRERLDALAPRALSPRLRLTPPLRYLDMVALVSGARLVLTDSGGLQEETAVLGVPCLTLRENTERPVTVSAGTNRIVGHDPTDVRAAIADTLEASVPEPASIEGWDGRASERILDRLQEKNS